MPRYLQLAKYTPEALAAVLEAGYSSRQQLADQITGSLGGRVESYNWMKPGGEWDAAVIWDMPAEAFFAMSGRIAAGGALARSVIYEIQTSQEADAAAAAEVDYTPPGDG